MSRPRPNKSSIARTVSAIGGAWTPAEFVKMTGLASIVGVSALPVFGLQIIGEETAKQMMSEYEAVSAD